MTWFFQNLIQIAKILDLCLAIAMHVFGGRAAWM